MSLTRIGYASVNVVDLESALPYYTETIGLRLIERTSDRRAYLQAHDGQDHHCLILNATSRSGLDHAGFKVNDPRDLDTATRMLHERHIKTTSIAANEIAGQGPGIRFSLPSGHDLVLYYHADKVGYGSGMMDPDPVATMPHLATTHLDHIVIGCERPAELTTFLCERFGFYVTEEVTGPEDVLLLVFLSCSNTMHDLAIALGPNGSFHHMGFGLESRSDVVARLDMLKRRDLPTMEYGITRHGIAGMTTVYCDDPSGNRIEFFNGAYLAPGIGGRVPLVRWDPPDSIGRGAFYYEGRAPETFFTKVT